jgi:hypothetical protein
MPSRQYRVETGGPFERARRKAFWRAVLSFLTGRDDRLLAWSSAREELHVQGEPSIQLKTVPLDQIVGTVGRYEDFDRAFLPTHDELEGRWRSIYRAFDAGTALPPVLLYQIGDAYFVVDGHHRVSVAKQRGMRHLEAQVVRVETRAPVSKHLDAKELSIRGEYTRFLEQTRLDELRPGQQIEFTTRGGYDRLLDQIGVHLQEKGPKSPGAWERAVCEWYDHTYLPLVQIIREHKVLEDFPSRTEADLYLWLMENQAELQAVCGPQVDPERAAEQFAARHGRNVLNRAASALRAWLSHNSCRLVSAERAEQ